MNTILDTIIASKKNEIARSKERICTKNLISKINFDIGSRNFTTSLKHIGKSHPAIIAEFKRGSPSLGKVRPDLEVKNQIKLYERGGAAAASVLTDSKFFFAKNNDIIDAFNHAKLPILRKEFIIDEYQIYESRALNADCILLIMSILTAKEAAALANTAHELKMDVLAEVHSHDELKYVLNEVECDLIGINNRNLKTFETSESNTLELAELIDNKSIIVAESGLKTNQAVKTLWDEGIRTFLIGEALIKSESPDETIRSFISVNQYHEYRQYK